MRTFKLVAVAVVAVLALSEKSFGALGSGGGGMWTNRAMNQNAAMLSGIRQMNAIANVNIPTTRPPAAQLTPQEAAVVLANFLSNDMSPEEERQLQAYVVEISNSNVGVQRTLLKFAPSGFGERGAIRAIRVLEATHSLDPSLENLREAAVAGFIAAAKRNELSILTAQDLVFRVNALDLGSRQVLACRDLFR